MKPNILYYSDCSFFAGCENMIANFLNDPILHADFLMSFAYNYSEKYEQGLNSRVSNTDYKKFPLRLMKQPPYNKPVNSALIWSIAHKVFYAFYLPLYKYFSILINTILLFRFFNKQKIDILHINNGGYPAAYSCYSAVIAGKLVGVNKIIYVVNNSAADYKHPYRWLDYPLDFFIKKWVTIFITGSAHAGERLKKILNLNAKKYLTINNGIIRRAITLEKEEFKTKYAIPNNRLLVSVVANLEKRKGHIFLLESILQMKNKYEGKLIPLFIFEGSGPEKNSLETYIAKNELKGDVVMIDRVPQIFDLINASDFIALPSISDEDFPNIVIEAMSLGKPVIGTKLAGIPEQIENGKSGIVVNPKSSQELEIAIMKLASNPSLIQQISIEAKSRFDNLFEKSISIKKYQRLYQSLI